MTIVADPHPEQLLQRARTGDGHALGQKAMRVLVTGASGFIGRHCLPLLAAAGAEVHGVALQRLPDPAPGVCWHRADLLDPFVASRLVAAVRPTHLLHLAWVTTPKEFWTSPENLSWVQASLHLLREFARGGGRRVVMAGTCAEYDWGHGYCVEGRTPCVPATLYGACKHSLQLVLEAFARGQGLSTAWARIFFLYGPHERPDRLVPSVTQALLRGEPVCCSSGEQVRDFLEVGDAADALVRLLQSDLRGPVNIASGVPVPVKEVVHTLADLLGRRGLVRLGALPDEGVPPVVVADVRRLKRELGWSARVRLEDGLRQVVTWWQGLPEVGHGAEP